MVDRDPISGIQRRVAGFHDIRLDGIVDLVSRARGCTVLDLGCNRGMVGFELACNGARLVHGCDHYAKGIEVAREVFADLRSCRSQFEVVDLCEPDAITKAFGSGSYDIVLCIATLHKLARIMSKEALDDFVFHIGTRTHRWLGWRSTERNTENNAIELEILDRQLGEAGLKRVQYSEISDLGPAGIWERPKR